MTLASLAGPYAIERRWGIMDPTLDPSREDVYSFLQGLLGEMAALFPDAYLHIGGDEVTGRHWNASPRIRQFVYDNGLRDNEALDAAKQRLAREFKVSTLVVLRRLHDAGRLSRAAFWQAFREEQERLAGIEARNAGGGDFYRTTTARVGKRFARALVESTLEGRTLYREAFQMLGIAKTTTFNELGRTLGLPT